MGDVETMTGKREDRRPASGDDPGDASRGSGGERA